MSIAAPDLAAIEAAIGAAEERTSAEIVVAVARRSGSYEDVALRTGIIGGGVAAYGIFLANALLDLALPVLIPATVVFCGLLFALHRSDALLRLLTSRRRREAAVRRELFVAFEEEEVRATRARNGLLVLVSLAERRVAFRADHGIEGHVPAAAWNEIAHRIESERGGDLVGALVANLPRVADVLEGPYPPCDDDRDEIPNRPRMRS